MNYVILSDIHANHLALQSVQVAVARQYDPLDTRYVFLGDLLGYGPLEGVMPCFEWFQTQENLLALPGNHEEWVATPMGLVSNVSNGALISLRAHRAYLEQVGLSDSYFRFVNEFASQPRDQQVRTILTSQVHLLFTHADFSEDGLRIASLFPWESGKIKAMFGTVISKYPDEKLALFCGHTHYPMMVSFDADGLHFHDIHYGKPQPLANKVMINGGSVGQPRDGDPRAAYVVYNDFEHTVTFFRVDYNVDRLVRMLKADKDFASMRHKLLPAAREFILERVGGYANVEKGYASLIQRIQTGDGGTDLSKYQEIYQRTDLGLQALR